MKNRGKKKGLLSWAEGAWDIKDDFFSSRTFLLISIGLLILSILVLAVVAPPGKFTGYSGSDEYTVTVPLAEPVPPPPESDVLRGVNSALSQVSKEVPKIAYWIIGDPYTDPERLASFLPYTVFRAWGVMIIHFMVWLILFFSFYYIFANFVFVITGHKFVAWVVSFAVAVIGANLGIVTTIVGWMAAGGAIFGAASVFVAMGVAFVFFIIMTVVGNHLKVVIAKRMAKEIKGGGIITGATISALKEMAKELRGEK